MLIYAGVKSCLDLSLLGSPTYPKQKFEFTLDAQIQRGSLAQAELACNKAPSCTGFLLSKDLKTSYLLSDSFSPTVMCPPSPPANLNAISDR